MSSADAPDAPALPDLPALVLGTAGHIDHGKTALIRALTGVDTDRLPEEKARGITIELGFAPLDLGDGLQVGVVDVPGHERLVRTMVAGATGIDLVLLVVAADEGVMPQTREHVAICNLLGITRGVAALTKVDTVDEDMAGLAAEETTELLAAGSLARAPVLQVSALTGAGLGELRAALRTLARQTTARTPRRGPPRLGIDRVFAAKGFGAVVTGTLVGAPLCLGDTLEILPRGARARVRGLQSFGVARERVLSGARCAVNLQGVAVGELTRGDVLSLPGALAPTQVLDAEVHWLAGAPASEGPTAVEFLAGTRETRGKLAPIGREKLVPGESGFARIHLEGEPMALLPGDRFVVRGFARTAAAGATLGGGRVLDVAPPHRRRSDPALVAELAVLAAGDPSETLRVRVTREGFSGIARTRLLQETGLESETLDTLLAEAKQEGSLVCTGAGVWLAAARAEALEARAVTTLEAFHHSDPLQPGMPRGALKGALPENCAAGAFDLALERLERTGRITAEGERVRSADHVPRLTQEQEACAARIRADAMIAGLEPPSAREWSDELGVPQAELRDLLAHLERDGSLVRAPGDLWFDRGTVDELRSRVVAHLTTEGSLETAAYKRLIGTTRKYAVPLMELFDEESLTMRKGETRILRPRSNA